MKVIGLGHYSRTGKSLLATFIEQACKRRKLKCRVMPFAWKLKEVCYGLYAWAGHKSPDFYETQAGAKARKEPLPALGMTPVDLWVEFGNKVRAVYSATWLDYVLKADHGAELVVIPDVRFPNEADAIRAAGGLLIRVVRPGVKPLDTESDQALLGFDGWDRTIENKGEKDDVLLPWGRALADWAKHGKELPKG